MLFSTLAAYLQKLEGTRSRNAITGILAELLHHADSREIGKLCYLLQGRVAPLYEATEFGMADKFMIRAISRAYGVPSDEVIRKFKELGDLGKAATALHHGKTQKLEVRDAYNLLRQIAETGGQGSQEKKIQLLSDILIRVDAVAACYVVRIPLDKLRLGFSETTILDSLSWMLKGDKSLRSTLEDAYNVRPDIGYISETVKKEGIRGLSHVRARVGSPVLAQLCQRLPNASDMIKKMGKVAVEPKYDGVRVQIHVMREKKGGATVATFSRNLERTTDMFPELSEIRKEVAATEAILDCEAVGLDPKTGKITSFQETSTRKRKHGIGEASKSVPLRFFVFDILYTDGKDLLAVPLSERRNILARTVRPARLLAISPQIVTDDPTTLRAYHDKQLRLGLEGVVVKKWNSPYEPGRRGYSWVKFKEEEGRTGKLTDTIDAVIMGYYLGEGKRTGFGIGAFLVGVRKNDQFVTVTKIGTGVSDDLWKDLRKQLHAIEARGIPKEYRDVSKGLIPDVWVRPRIVVELAGDDVTKSPNHTAGFAVRFPRLVRIRTDKRPDQATTVREVEEMFNSQKTRSHE